MKGFVIGLLVGLALAVLAYTLTRPGSREIDALEASINALRDTVEAERAVVDSVAPVIVERVVRARGRTDSVLVVETVTDTVIHKDTVRVMVEAERAESDSLVAFWRGEYHSAYDRAMQAFEAADRGVEIARAVNRRCGLGVTVGLAGGERGLGLGAAVGVSCRL